MVGHLLSTQKKSNLDPTSHHTQNQPQENSSGTPPLQHNIAEELAQPLRALGALAEDPGLVAHDHL